MSRRYIFGSPDPDAAETAALDALSERVGRLYLRQRLGLEREYEAQVFRSSARFFDREDWYSAANIIRTGLRLAGLHGRARRNALAIELRRNTVVSPRLPIAFDGFTVLHLSDLHLDISEGFVDALIARIGSLQYDLCVLTGDYRARTFGAFGPALAGMEKLRPHVKGAPHAVLGNHDSIRMVPGLERAGYRVLINECTPLARAGGVIFLAGIDEAHFYQLDNLHRAAEAIPQAGFSILLSHTPEAYRHAAHAGIDVMLSGHTHGGQICLPGGIPIFTDADSPRRIARGAWRHDGMAGYTSAGAGTSILDVRLNCPAEVTLHTLRRSGGNA